MTRRAVCHPHEDCPLCGSALCFALHPLPTLPFRLAGSLCQRAQVCRSYSPQRLCDVHAWRVAKLLSHFILEKQSCRLIAGNSRSTKYPVQIRPLDMARRLASPYQYRQLQVFRVASP